jgi:hypothetical protein
MVQVMDPRHSDFSKRHIRIVGVYDANTATLREMLRQSVIDIVHTRVGKARAHVGTLRDATRDHLFSAARAIPGAECL